LENSVSEEQSAVDPSTTFSNSDHLSEWSK